MQIESDYFLSPGELYITNKKKIITTILGSCISIVIYCRSHSFYAISHCVLPSKNEDDCLLDFSSEPFKYVDCTINFLLQKVDQFNIPKSKFDVKLFGGSSKRIEGQYNASVAEKNIQMALTKLNQNKIHISAQDIRGNLGRKIHFNTETGEIFLKRF